MLAQSVFYTSGPLEVSGNSLSTSTGNLGSAANKYSNLFLTGTGFADEFSARKASYLTGEITGLSISNLYPRGTPDLGHATMPWKDLYLSGTGSAYKFDSVNMAAQSGEFLLAAVYNLKPYGTPNLGENNLRWNNLFLTGDATIDELISRLVSSKSGEITGLSISNLYPIGQPNLGQETQKWNNSYITGTGYSYSQEVVYDGRSEEVITRAETTGRFVSKTVSINQNIDFASGIVSGLFFNLKANKTYKLDYNLHYSGSATTEGINLCFSGTNQATFAAGDILINDFNSVMKAYPVTGYLHVISNNQGSTDRNTIFCNLLVTNSSSDSTLYLIASKETNSSSPAISINSGSWATMMQY